MKLVAHKKKLFFHYSDLSISGRAENTSTETNFYNLQIQQVSSIILMQNGVDIAAVTQTVPSKALTNPANFKVIGDISRSSTQHRLAFLNKVLDTLKEKV